MSTTAPETDDGLPKEGEILAGKYRVERVLGQGGMGVVVAAQHQALRQTVAVKLLLREAMERHDSVERFLREARAAVSIQSEHIARVLDVGTLDGGRPFMVMEYLVGQDLGEVLKSRGALPIPEAVDYVLQACEAIAEAHMLGIVHRDLKPANMFVTRRADGSALVKVLDFGLSKVTKADSLEPSLTTANTVMGSPYYMSPEQVRSLKTIDARADIWALGVILYQLISNRRPFEEESLGALFVMIGAEPPAPLDQALPGVPPDLQHIVEKCLEKQPANRFQSVAELARALAPFATDGARISIERILRTLSDNAPLTRRPPLESSSSVSLDRPSAPSGNLVAATSSPRTSTPPAAIDESSKPPSQESMPGMSKSLAGPAIEAASTTGRHAKSGGSKVALYVLATVLALIAGAATVLLLMRGDAGGAAASGLDATARPTADVSRSATTAVPNVVPATATAAETTTAAPTAAPTTTATAGAAAAPSSSGSAGAKKWTPTKKKTDPLDRR
ncbi:MAG: serine/threonine-protein kinase [Polyangiaceae bacterium]